ncbi:YihY/virulence factor BrkB family protein [Lacinutrix sp. 5H-3-7-4]|uniref:YihY/virulence factor BrkB family protein n=1 Tax=Lacinutrix sp. (strain 5H-3-7-4) TaxID=983544 RepID=UPI00020A3541|nr:YihY/virulence factor BrkB family protein [Lacinutrix sp. 5H-3-7-4]AEH02303.1 ribonuclease BN [Lacinutrix sp. 5H-3-7-4]
MSDSKKFKLIQLPKLLAKAGSSWFKGKPFERSAIVAYYAILSLPALIIIILNIVGGIWGRDIVQGELLNEITKAIGPDTAESIRLMIVQKGSETTSVFATIVGVGTLIYGSTGVFFQLQSALDNIWESESNFENSIVATIVSRLKSFGFILIIGFLLLTSFILTSLLSTFNKRLENILPENLLDFLFIFDFLISIGFIYLLFAAMFKFLPSAKISWKTVKVGALLTTVLFLIGKYLLAIYFSEMEPGSTYGAAGSIILIMLWVSYSSLILLFGAHFTKIYSDEYVNKKDVSNLLNKALKS